jgi:hypothetical protein
MGLHGLLQDSFLCVCEIEDRHLARLKEGHEIAELFVQAILRGSLTIFVSVSCLLPRT